MALGKHQALADFLDGRLFQQYAEAGTDGNYASYKIAREVDTEQYPLHLREALMQDFQFFDVIEIK